MIRSINPQQWLPACMLLCLLVMTPSPSCKAQVDQNKVGAWYMYFFDFKPQEKKIGFQGDIQFRNWDLGGDLEQLLLRGGITYRPHDKVKLTLGYGNITTGAYGESTLTSTESRIYQEALLPHDINSRLSLTHRFRYEQRFVEGQDFRTRFRYNLFLTLPLSAPTMDEGTLYASAYNELFVNGEQQIGEGRTTQLFDRNRTYLALGYVLAPKTKIQLGFMSQRVVALAKEQFQVSVHSSF